MIGAWTARCPSTATVRRQITKTDINRSHWLRQITMLRLLIVGCISAPFARVITADWITDSQCFHASAGPAADRSSSFGFARNRREKKENCNLCRCQHFETAARLDVSLSSLHLGIRLTTSNHGIIDGQIPQAYLIALFVVDIEMFAPFEDTRRAVTAPSSISRFFKNTFYHLFTFAALSSEAWSGFCSRSIYLWRSRLASSASSSPHSPYVIYQFAT